MGGGHRPGGARAAPAPRTAAVRALLAATAACCALHPGQAAGIGFPLGGDGGPELWDAVVASIGGHPMEPMMALIDSGANLHWRNPEMKQFTVLIYSAMRGCRMTTRRLLRAGADVGDVSIHGNTPLHFAAMHGYEDVVRELLEYGAIADQKNDKGKTPLDKAIEHELDYRPKHSGARHSSHIVQLLEDALGGKREDL